MEHQFIYREHIGNTYIWNTDYAAILSQGSSYYYNDRITNYVSCEEAPVALKSANKLDQDKVMMQLLSVPAMREIAKVMTFGAQKYAPNAWRDGMEWSRLYGAALRHLTAHMEGEDTDPESGLSHLAHLGCCVMFLLEFEQTGNGTDDRYKTATDRGTCSESKRA